MKVVKVLAVMERGRGNRISSRIVFLQDNCEVPCHHRMNSHTRQGTFGGPSSHTVWKQQGLVGRLKVAQVELGSNKGQQLDLEEYDAELLCCSNFGE